MILNFEFQRQSSQTMILLMATLLDIENLDSKKRFIINLLHNLYKNGQLIIPENLMRAVVIIEAYISDSNFFYEKIPKETEIDASFFERFTKSNICFLKLNTSTSIKSSIFRYVYLMGSNRA